MASNKEVLELKTTVAELQAKAQTFEAALKRVEAEFVKRGFWVLATPPAPELPETYAIEPDYYDAGNGWVSVTFGWTCPECDYFFEHQKLQVTSSTSNPFVRILNCDSSHAVKVVFKRNHVG